MNDSPARAQMIKLGRLDREITDHIVKTSAARQLGTRHGDKLKPADHPAQLSTLMVPICQDLEFMSRNQLEQLRKHVLL